MTDKWPVSDRCVTVADNPFRQFKAVSQRSFCVTKHHLVVVVRVSFISQQMRKDYLPRSIGENIMNVATCVCSALVWLSKAQDILWLRDPSDTGVTKVLPWWHQFNSAFVASCGSPLTSWKKEHYLGTCFYSDWNFLISIMNILPALSKKVEMWSQVLLMMMMTMRFVVMEVCNCIQLIQMSKLIMIPSTFNV